MKRIMMVLLITLSILAGGCLATFTSHGIHIAQADDTGDCESGGDEGGAEQGDQSL